MSSSHTQLGILPGVDYCQVTRFVCVCVCVFCGRGDSGEGELMFSCKEEQLIRSKSCMNVRHCVQIHYRV
jgi:hypothetical protein